MALADVEAETLLTVVLGLVVVWLLLEIAEQVLELLVGPFGALVGVVIVLLIVLWLVDVP